jgi:hypothetical protein
MVAGPASTVIWLFDFSDDSCTSSPRPFPANGVRDVATCKSRAANASAASVPHATWNILAKKAALVAPDSPAWP